MNIESAKKLLAKKAIIMIEQPDKVILDGDATLEVINEIYASAKKKVCKECKHLGSELSGKHDSKQLECNNGVGFNVCAYTNKPYVIPTFGCNMFEKKEKDI